MALRAQIFAFIAVLFVVVPLVAWSTWRVILSAQRMKARAKEQAEFAVALREARGLLGGSDDNHNGH